MNDIKARIKSVQSTMQITKAMELVATSKLRRAKERVEKSRPFHETLGAAIKSLEGVCEMQQSIYRKKSEGKKPLFVVIAGDRGLAGGYNSNIFRLAAALDKSDDGLYFPIGKKALEHYKAKGKKIFSDALAVTAEVGVGDALAAAQIILNAFLSGECDKVVLVYTNFTSMMTQTPLYEELLPFADEICENDAPIPKEPIIDGVAEEILDGIVANFVGGILWAAICESLASESGARRSAMSAANKNASEMIDTLMLKYNRARQAVITQEITEIVSGAEAL